MLTKLLIAGRDELVPRIARTCERMGVATVAIRTEDDAAAPHAAACDEVVSVGPTRKAYGDAAAIVAAAKAIGAAAIHPGGGPRQADAALARATIEAGLVWVGAAPELIERLGSPAELRELARLTGVRVLPRADAPLPSVEEATTAASELGYPVQLSVDGEPAHGPIAVDVEDELAGAFATCRERATTEQAGVVVERWLDRPRVLSVIVLADAQKALGLGEVERSVRSEGRVLIDEVPAPALRGPVGELKQKTLRESAVQLARECGLRGLGAAEFVLDVAGHAYLRSFRAGLPIEHPLIEMCTGLDLIELQLRIASGEALSPATLHAQFAGHAAQAYLYAQAPLPGPAALTAMRWPVLPPGSLRVETDLTVGAQVTPDRESPLATLIAHGATRHQALLTLDRGLAEATIEPVGTNVEFAREVLGDESFRAGQFDSEFSDRLVSELRTRTPV